MRESFAAELDRLRYQKQGWLGARNVAELSSPTADEAEAFGATWFSLDDGVRQRFAEALSRCTDDDPSLDFLALFTAMLDDELPAVRVLAIGSLADCCDELVANRLLDVLRNDSAAEARAEAAATIGFFIGSVESEDISDTLRRAIGDALLETINTPEEEVTVRQRALEAFAFSEDPYVDEVLEEAYDSDEDEMRASALFAMGRRGEEGWLPTIHRELRNEVETIRLAAICACSEIGSASSIPFLLQVIGEDPEQDVRVAAVLALADFETPEAGRILEDLLESDDVALVSAADEAIDMRTSTFGDEQLPMFDYGPWDDDDLDDGDGQGSGGDQDVADNSDSDY